MMHNRRCSAAQHPLFFNHEPTRTILKYFEILILLKKIFLNHFHFQKNFLLFFSLLFFV
ncbi:MAG: hypothetical protein LBQ50_05610 [Planctomycetaceae bacterium]|nr:hypothetical protein [Planctomycetaceae bacterium]